MRSNQDGTIGNSYTAGSVIASGSGVGGLVGFNSNPSGIGDTNYWDTDTTRQTAACGLGTCSAVGLLATQMQDGSSPSGLGLGFQLMSGSYPKLYKCEIDPATNACVADSFLDEPVPGQ